MRNRQKFYFLWLTLICIGVFILQLMFENQGFTELFFLSENALSQPWQFMTAVFLHGSLTHLVYNLFALFIFGAVLEQIIGSRRFLLLFLVSGILANFISFWWFPNALGASGAIMAVIGCLAVLRPTMAVWAFGMVLPMFIVAALWVAGSVIGIFGFGEQGVGHLAHLSGIIIGLAYGAYIKANSKRQRVFFQRKVKIPEREIRGWEDRFIDK